MPKRHAPSDNGNDNDEHHNCRDERHAGLVERRLLRPPLNEFHCNLLEVSIPSLNANPLDMGLPYPNAQDDAMTAPAIRDESGDLDPGNGCPARAGFQAGAGARAANALAIRARAATPVAAART